MKHIKLLALAGVCALSIVGCSHAQADKAATETQQTEQTAEAKDNVLTPESDNQLRPGMKPETLTVIDFNATWCGPCKIFAPIFHKASGMYPNVKFYSVDVDQYQATSNAFDIHAIPTIMLISPDGKTKTIVGLDEELTAGITDETSDFEAEKIVLANFSKLIEAASK